MAHKLRSLRNMHHIDQLNTTQQKQGIETICSFLGSGHTILRLGRRRIAPDIVTTRTRGPKASKPTNLPEYTYPPNEGIGKNNTYATIPRIMKYEMIPDTLPHPTRSLITTFRPFLRISILAVGSALSANSLLFALRTVSLRAPVFCSAAYSRTIPPHQHFSFPRKTRKESLGLQLTLGPLLRNGSWLLEEWFVTSVSN